MQDDFILNELKKFNVTDAYINKLKEKYLKLKVENPNDLNNYLTCKESHQLVRNLRINVEKKRVELKSSSLTFGRAVDSEAKRITIEIEKIEEHLFLQRKIVEDEKERIRKEKEAAILAEEAEKKRIKEAEEKAARDAEEARLEKIRIEQEAITLAQKEKEDELNRKIKEIKDAEIEAENKRKIELAKKQAAQEAEDRIKKENELKERERLEKIQKEKEAEDLRISLLPDNGKLTLLSSIFENIAYPEFSSVEAKNFICLIKKDVENIILKLKKGI